MEINSIDVPEGNWHLECLGKVEKLRHSAYTSFIFEVELISIRLLTLVILI